MSMRNGEGLYKEKVYLKRMNCIDIYRRRVLSVQNQRKLSTKLEVESVRNNLGVNIIVEE